jgi:hypothetical protein
LNGTPLPDAAWQHATGPSLPHPAAGQDGSQGLAHSQGPPVPAAAAQVAMPVPENISRYQYPLPPKIFLAVLSYFEILKNL